MFLLFVHVEHVEPIMQNSASLEKKQQWNIINVQVHGTETLFYSNIKLMFYILMKFKYFSCEALILLEMKLIHECQVQKNMKQSRGDFITFSFGKESMFLIQNTETFN